jgi:YacP-like NYN domain-containing protein
VVLVDAENVRRSTWPNISAEELVELVVRWAAAESVRAVIVFDGSAPPVDVGEAPVELVSTDRESADDWIVREATAPLEKGPLWLVTSDRELRERVGATAARSIGGGSFARTLLDLRD